MANNQDSAKDLFAQAKKAFGQLDLEQKSTFLAQELANTTVDAVRSLVDTISTECADLFNSDTSGAEKPPKDEPEPAA